MSNMPNYAVITPVRDEGEHLPDTIESMASQSIRPSLWVVVNDGSSDDTGTVAEAAAAKYSWVRVVHRPDRGFRKAGGGVVEAFYDGYKMAGNVPWDFLVKLDGDLSFKPSYFQSCIQRFERDPSLGLGGGTICNDVGGVWVAEAKGDPPFHVRGATKIYRRACWEAIGGLLRAPGWDTLDEFKANMLGWKTYSFRELKLLHHRIAGEVDGAWKNWFKNGRANYISGYHPLFMMLKCTQRMFKKPYGVAGLGLMSGFASGYLNDLPQVEDRALIGYVRRQQLNRLLFRDNLWDRPAPEAVAEDGKSFCS